MVMAALVLCALTALGAEPRWRVQYFHDEDDSSLVIIDLKFPSPRRGLAAGTLAEKGSIKPVMVSTNDGGRTWSTEKLKEIPVSMFFLNDSLGWMVTTQGIWRTDEAGRQWRKISSRKGILRIYFLNANRGFAVGPQRTILETVNGGVTWTTSSVAEKLATSKTNTVLAAIDFLAGRFGLIAGWSHAPRRDHMRVPDWMDPQEALKRRERPGTTVLLETRDAGASWTPQVVSMFGRITEVLLCPKGIALSLVEFDNAFEWPSEVFQVDLRTGKSDRVYREKDRVVTGMYLAPEGVGYLATIDCTPTLHSSPIPTKVRVYRSADLENWHEMPVDYRTVAHRATLAAADSSHIWMATNTGMILKLETD